MFNSQESNEDLMFLFDKYNEFNTEINSIIFEAGRELNHKIHYYTCETVQEQRMYMAEIADNIFVEDWVSEEPKKYAKKHSLRNAYNMDPAYESYKNRKYVDYYAA